MSEVRKKILAITACPTGVAHTYMAQEKLDIAAKELGYDIKVETHGSIGTQNKFTDEDIAQADVVIIAVTISLGQLDMERFNNKLVYHVNINDVIKDPKKEIVASFEKGQLQQGSKKIEKFKADKQKQSKSWVNHLMTGISFMIPFIVFAGITSALIAGIVNAMNIPDGNGGSIKDIGKAFIDGKWASWVTNDGMKVLYIFNAFANIGFTVMMPIAGAYIANSIAGRSAIAPAFILTFLGNSPTMWWHGYFENIYVDNRSIVDTMQGLNIVGALIFGLTVGYLVNWINTKWKINRYIQPIMPIIIIPVFVTLILGTIWIFTFGPVLGIAMGYVFQGIQIIGKSNVGMPVLGLVLGLLAGVDLGGPINKIASFGATALIAVDGGKAMGASAAAFAVAPLGAGLASFIFKNKFKDDRAMGINATILGFMGVSESAIPFAIKYRWAAIVPNIICSGIAGMCAGLFQVSGHVGAWGGPIIAIFAGVTTYSNSFVGIPLYLLAIAIGVIVHIILFRILVEVQTKGKLTTDDFKNIFKKSKKEKAEKLLKRANQ
ncbi:MAG: fructose PTS transporter subunit IIB [Spiroplasma sp.]|nr:fructose PTS transporter subunit IIB [Spiroplasma sp.]